MIGEPGGGLLRLADRALWRATTAATALGERHGIDWLTYSPLQLLAYHRLAAGDAPDLALALHQTFPASRRWVDVGAGSGALAAAAAKRGLDVLACERARSGRALAWLQGVKTAPFEVGLPVPAELGAGFDLATCFEVGEHLQAERASDLVRWIARLAPVVVFSAAQPGQGGVGHINEQPPEYWQALFADVGARPDLERREALVERLSAQQLHAEWIRGNVQVFLT